MKLSKKILLMSFLSFLFGTIGIVTAMNTSPSDGAGPAGDEEQRYQYMTNEQVKALEKKPTPPPRRRPAGSVYPTGPVYEMPVPVADGSVHQPSRSKRKPSPISLSVDDSEPRVKAASGGPMLGDHEGWNRALICDLQQRISRRREEIVRLKQQLLRRQAAEEVDLVRPEGPSGPMPSTPPQARVSLTLGTPRRNRLACDLERTSMGASNSDAVPVFGDRELQESSSSDVVSVFGGRELLQEASSDSAAAIHCVIRIDENTDPDLFFSEGVASQDAVRALRALDRAVERDHRELSEQIASEKRSATRSDESEPGPCSLRFAPRIPAPRVLSLGKDAVTAGCAPSVRPVRGSAGAFSAEICADDLGCGLRQNISSLQARIRRVRGEVERLRERLLALQEQRGVASNTRLAKKTRSERHDLDDQAGLPLQLDEDELACFVQEAGPAYNEDSIFDHVVDIEELRRANDVLSGLLMDLENEMSVLLARIAAAQQRKRK